MNKVPKTTRAELKQQSKLNKTGVNMQCPVKLFRNEHSNSAESASFTENCAFTENRQSCFDQVNICIEIWH